MSRVEYLSWGTELWDKYDELSAHALRGIEFLESYVGNFIKERGKIEAEYAKKLRSLEKNFALKDIVRPANEEFTHIKAYKLVSIKKILFN